MLRPGNAGSFTAADHIAVLTATFGQIPAGRPRFRWSKLARPKGLEPLTF